MPQPADEPHAPPCHIVPLLASTSSEHERSALTALITRGGHEDESAAHMVYDEALQSHVLELLEPTMSVEFSAWDSPCHLLSLHVENTGSYFGFEVEVVDSKGKQRRLAMNNNQSVCRVRTSECSMPLVLTPGWNMLLVDLADMVHRAFGTEFAVVQTVIVHATCRIWHVFLHDEQLAEPQLPPSLRVIK